MESIWNLVNKDITQILTDYRRIAIVGLSDNPMRPSYGVAAYLMDSGYSISPVNPNYRTILGLLCFPDLEAIGQPVEIVNIFRRPVDVPPVVEQAIKIGAKVVWMQSGIAHEQAARLALNAGLKVVMNACIKIEHSINIG
jgi:predicted CoA-binding protein